MTDDRSKLTSNSWESGNGTTNNLANLFEMNNQAFSGPIGPVGINGSGVLAYGSVYGSNANGPVSAGSLVDFTSSGPLLNTTVNLSANTVSVAATGIYIIQYNLNVALAVTSTLLAGSSRIVDVALNVNGTEDPTSFSSYSITNFSGVAATLAQVGSIGKGIIRSLNSNDVVTLRFRSTSTGPGAGTYTSPSLIITRIE
ncbi:hypothetical protein [Peribacillus muralis]|uniref:hypothetical protein n=1 Tax=Peribacillus muralis TaxID=264697 RepID=UPI003670F418